MKAYQAEALILAGVLEGEALLEFVDGFVKDGKTNRKCRVELAALTYMDLESMGAEEIINIGIRWGWGYDMLSKIDEAIVSKLQMMTSGDLVKLGESLNNWRAWALIQGVLRTRNISELDSKVFLTLLKSWKPHHLNSGAPEDPMPAELERRYSEEAMKALGKEDLLEIISADVQNRSYAEKAYFLLNLNELTNQDLFLVVESLPEYWPEVTKKIKLEKLGIAELLLVISKVSSQKAKSLLYAKLQVGAKTPEQLLESAITLNHDFIWQIVMEELRSRALTKDEWFKLGEKFDCHKVWIEAIQSGDMTKNEFYLLGLKLDTDELWDVIIEQLKEL